MSICVQLVQQPLDVSRRGSDSDRTCGVSVWKEGDKYMDSATCTLGGERLLVGVYSAFMHLRALSIQEHHVIGECLRPASCGWAGKTIAGAHDVWCVAWNGNEDTGRTRHGVA